MSIAILTQVYDEMRRLAIAGSVVAGGDFRLKKLVPQLEQVGAKAPVFSKVADAVKKVVDAREQESAEALLDLTTLVNAILYTQGETTIPGTLAPIETIDLGTSTTQASARMLKPLLEALTTTGPGRMEIIKDAFERGVFRDLRLVKPALGALDDPYPEIADFIAEKVLPLYGKAVVPELISSFDAKGKGGHARRLLLMHRIDPEGARELVKQVLDNGSKEVKVAAVECLGGSLEDLSFLLEQASAKAQDIRQAAYRALARMKEEPAVAVLQKALGGKDLHLAAQSIRDNGCPQMMKFVIAEAEKEIASLPKVKDKKEVDKRVDRARALVGCLDGKEPHVEAFLMNAFNRREALAGVKGQAWSGKDLNTWVVHAMAEGTPKLKATLAEAHAALIPEELATAFRAARQALPPNRVFELFSPYLKAKAADKKKRDTDAAKCEVICNAMWRYHRYGRMEEEAEEQPLDPRWLDVAVATENLALIQQLGRSDHKPAMALLKKKFEEILKKSRNLDECHEAVASMIYSNHPEATDAFLAALEKHKQSQRPQNFYWFFQMIPDLPSAAVPRLEACVPTVVDKMADIMVDYIQRLRGKN